MKHIILTLLLFSSISVANSQNGPGLTQRENLDSWVYKQGTRPKAGDYGFFLAASTLDIKKWESVSPLSYLNFRYYLTDDLVMRTGLRLFKEKTVTSGEGTQELGSPFSTFYDRKSDRKYALTVGIEKHLNPGNMLDVYFATDVRAGYRNIAAENNSEPIGGGSKTESFLSRRSIDYGMGCYIGLQAFVADLPLSIAVEAGFQGAGSVWQKAVGKETVGTTTTEFELEVDDELNVIDQSTKFSSVSTRRFDLDASLKFSLCYFFTR